MKPNLFNDDPRHLAPLHPRAIRVALERVLEHHQYQCHEHSILKMIYNTVLCTENASHEELDSQMIHDFDQHHSDSERDQWVLNWFKNQCNPQRREDNT